MRDDPRSAGRARRSLNDRFEAWVLRNFPYARERPHRRRALPAEPAPRRSRPMLRVAGLALGVAAPLVVAAGLIPLRDVIEPSTAALILVLPVLAAALTAGYVPGALSAVVAAVAFDVFLTRPYESPTIHAAADVESAIVLLVISLVVSHVVARELDTTDRSVRRRQELRALQDVVGNIAAGDAAELTREATTAISTILSVECRWAPGYHGTAGAVLERDGSIEGQRDEAILPDDTELPVVSGGIELGRLILRARRPTVVSREERGVAIAIADLLAHRLAEDTGSADDSSR